MTAVKMFLVGSAVVITIVLVATHICLFCSEGGSSPTTPPVKAFPSAAVGEVTSITTVPTYYAPTLEASIRIMGLTGRLERFRAMDKEARSAGWSGTVLIGSPDCVKVLEKNLSYARVRLVDLRLDPIDDNQREGWIPIESIEEAPDRAASHSGATSHNCETTTDTLDKPAKPTAVKSTGILTVPDFLSSDFCVQYSCSEIGKSSDVSHMFGTTIRMQPSNQRLYVDVLTGGDTVRVLSMMFMREGERLEEGDFKIIEVLLESTNQSEKHESTMSFIRQNIEEPAHQICQGQSVVDGEFRVWVAKVTEQTLWIERIAGPALSPGYTCLAGN
jgi:hypothetical protein